MTLFEHESYAMELLSSLTDGHLEIENLRFEVDRTRRGNAARAMTAILCHRLFMKSSYQPKLKERNTYEWNDGIFMCRNISDRPYMWTNVRRNVADVVHGHARNNPVAYLLAFLNPTDTSLSVWALPEPLLYYNLPKFPVKKSGQEYSVQIFPNKQRFEHFAASPDLAPFFLEIPMFRQETRALSESREADALLKETEETTQEGEDLEIDKDDDGTEEYVTSALLADAAQQLTEAGVFDPSGISDARERVFSSIVRRRGQPAFRQQLLAAYDGRCAITGCNLEPVLDAAHIFPYMGPETNHPRNGLLLRTDLHTLFDLKLIAIDIATMCLVVSSALTGTCYDEYHGRPIKVPEDASRRPSREALAMHRQESGL